MREIKFRVWDSTKKLMILPEYAYWEDFFINADGTVSQMLETGTYETYRYEKSLGKDVVLMQFTGLQDKNGVDIFEGDILEFKNDLGRRHLHKVFRAEGGLVINSHDSDIDKKNIVFYQACADMQTAGWIKQCAVIGNIHENPELLNK